MLLAIKSSVNRLLQAANDKYFKNITLKYLCCQPEHVEGGFIIIIRVRHPDNYRDTLTAFLKLFTQPFIN